MYANVAMRPPEEVFEAFWPRPYRRVTLDPYFDLAAHMIGVRPVQPHPVTGALPRKTERLRHLGDSFGHPGSVFQPNLAVRFDEPMRGEDGLTRNRFGVVQAACIHCGECDIGCNVGAKNTLDLNYLALAERHGAQVATLTTATHLEPTKSGYLVHLTPRDSSSGQRGQVRRVTARQVFVCAGALGSTELLLRSRDQYHTLPDLPAALGAGYSGNGDFIAFGSRTNDALRPNDGPTITSAAILRGTSGQEPWFLMEEGGYSTHLAGLVRALHPGRLALLEVGRLADGVIGPADVGRQRGPDEHSVVLLVMGRDRADGRIRLRGPQQRLQVEWDTAGNLPLYAAQEAACRDVVQVLGGRLSTLPTWRLLRQPISVHNLGGCRMAESAATGVVDVDGQVFGHPGLYVLEGAVLPAATGVNPSHTITAVAERCIEGAVRQIAGQPDWVAPETPDVRPVDCPEDRIVAVAARQPLRPTPRGIRFSETMRGTCLLSADTLAGSTTPRVQQVTVTLHVAIPDLDAFLADPEHTATVSGRIGLDAVTGTRGAAVHGGALHLLTRSSAGRGRTMAYVLPFTDAEGGRWALNGHKDVWRHRGLDIWATTTTLHTSIASWDGGPSEPPQPTVVVAGTLRLGPRDLARQLRSLRVTGAESPREVLAVLSSVCCGSARSSSSRSSRSLLLASSSW